MQIREQGEIVKLIRAGQGPGAPRIRHTVVGTFRVDRSPTSALLDLLTDDELAALDRWLAARRAQTQNQQTVATVPTGLNDLTSAINAAAELLSRAEAVAIRRDLAAVAHALARSGHARPKPTVRKPKSAPPGQGDLLESRPDSAPPSA